MPWFTGFRISEILSLTVSSVWRDGKFLPKVGVQPRHLKGGFGRTRWMPLLPEMQRALEQHMQWLSRSFALTPELPLFPSRQHNHGVRAITRSQAHAIVKDAFAAAHIEDDGRLGTHTLRKTFARAVYKNSGNDLMVLKAALNHSDVSVTQRYLDVGEDAVAAAVARCDFTRAPRKSRSVALPSLTPSLAAVA